MDAHDFLRSVLSRLPSRQLRRSQARRLARTLARGGGRYEPESLETRSMLSTTVGTAVSAQMFHTPLRQHCHWTPVMAKAKKFQEFRTRPAPERWSPPPTLRVIM